jgi:hypothetical protein
MLKIDQALISAFIDGNFGLSVAHENLPYNATDGAAYAELLVLQNDVTPLNLNDSNETDGVFRVILRYPANSGAIAVKQKADEIFGVFKVGARLRFDGVTVTITNNKRQPGIAEDGWYKIVLTMAYKAILNRN